MTSTQRNHLCQVVGVKTLESILRESFKDENLSVIDCNAVNFLPVGENFGSELIKLDVEISRGRTEQTEELNMLAKMMCTSGDSIVCWKDAFKKEVFVYTKLLPAYQELETEMGIEKNFSINLVPKYYGHCYSLSDDSDEVGNDSLFLMENMKMRDYYVLNMKTGLDMDHAKVTIPTLARFHAMGIALEQKRPELFKQAVALTQSIGIDTNFMDVSFQSLLENFHETLSFKKYMHLIESSFANSINGGTYARRSEEPWVTITHGDLWTNNMLFHKDGAGYIDDVKFVDFQVILCNSPLKDLAHLLLFSLEDETLIKHLDELLDLYYDEFKGSLERIGCDFDQFTKDSFDRELKEEATREFMICALLRKALAYEIKGEGSSAELLKNAMQGEFTDAMRNKIQVLFNIFEKKAWI